MLKIRLSLVVGLSSLLRPGSPHCKTKVQVRTSHRVHRQLPTALLPRAPCLRWTFLKEVRRIDGYCVSVCAGAKESETCAGSFGQRVTSSTIGTISVRAPRSSVLQRHHSESRISLLITTHHGNQADEHLGVLWYAAIYSVVANPRIHPH